jgi:hypothetical protein
MNSQLQCSRSGEPGPGRRAEDEARVGSGRGGLCVVRGRVVRLVGKEGREEGGKRVNNGRGDVLIPRESGGGPAHAPCKM